MLDCTPLPQIFSVHPFTSCPLGPPQEEFGRGIGRQRRDGKLYCLLRGWVSCARGRKMAKVCFTCSKEWAEESKNVRKSKKSVLEIQRGWRVWKNFGESQTKEIREHIVGNGLISYDVSWFFPVFSFIFSKMPWLLGSHWSQLLRSPWPRLGASFWQGKLHLSLLLARNSGCSSWKRSQTGSISLNGQ